MSPQTHEPLSYHNNAWPDGVADPPLILVEQWITHISKDYRVIGGTV